MAHDEQESGTAKQPEDRAPSAQSRAGNGVVRLRYLGGVSVLVSGPATHHQYSFSRLRPTQTVDARDAILLLRTRLFIWAW